MVSDLQRNQRLWERSLAAVSQELETLDREDRKWIVDRINEIAVMQGQIDELFRLADGPKACRHCSGACCDSGKNHFTLANLLAFLVAGEPPPKPDFSLPCPFLGATGCRIEPCRRPFNCITFACEPVLNFLGGKDRENYFALEKALHRLYRAFDRRFAGSSLCGLFIRAEGLSGRPFLGTPA
ncbi:MAG: hypothetical protein R2940_17240 [Syntrophotaleaceae bacterium]